MVCVCVCMFVGVCAHLPCFYMFVYTCMVCVFVGACVCVHIWCVCMYVWCVCVVCVCVCVEDEQC